MLAGRIAGATRTLNLAPEIPGRISPFVNLAVRDEKIGGFAAMVSAWIPTPDEIARIVLGAPIYLRLVATDHPIVAIDVGRTPAEAEASADEPKRVP